jgi:hypothetical protein
MIRLFRPSHILFNYSVLCTLKAKVKIQVFVYRIIGKYKRIIMDIKLKALTKNNILNSSRSIRRIIIDRQATILQVK